MQKYIVWAIVLVGLIGCGSSDSDKFKVSDDNNGTRSPRIAKVIVKDENNDTRTMLYSYNSDNLLIEKNTNLNNKHITTTVYKYNSVKQLVSVNTQDLLMHGYANDKFLYDEQLLYAKTKKPIVKLNEHSYGLGTMQSSVSKIEYEYEYNSNGDATKIVSSKQTVIDPPSTQLTQYIYDTHDRVIQVNVDDRIMKKYTYTSFGKLKTEYRYHYGRIGSDTQIEYSYDNNHLLVLSKEYSVEDSGDKFLSSTSEYVYENKPYYSNPSPSYLDLGQYATSGIY